MISIIIPTLNEENNIGRLLDSISLQSISNEIEIIIIDGKSGDKTKKIALSYKKKFKNYKFIESNVRNVSYQRNLGANKSTNERILFLDADVILPPGFLTKNITELNLRHLDVAGCYVEPMSDRIIDKFFHVVLNRLMWSLQVIYPHMPGFCIFSKKSIHRKLGGFDQTIKLAEDNDYVNRSRRIAKFRMLKSKKILCSVRRFNKEGRFITSIKYFLCLFYRLIFGEIRTDIFNYKFGHYGKQK